MRESITIKVYSDNYYENDVIQKHACFGWEVIDNQRYLDSGYSGSVQAYTNITFSREMNTPWYQGVVKLEKYYYELQKTINEYNGKHPGFLPPTRPSAIFLIFSIILAIVMISISLFGIVISRITDDSASIEVILPSAFTILISSTIALICIIKFFREYSKYKKSKERYYKELSEYEAEYPDKIKNLENEQALIRSSAREYIRLKSY